LVDNESIYIEAFRKDENGQWQVKVYNQPEQLLDLPYVALSLFEKHL